MFANAFLDALEQLLIDLFWVLYKAFSWVGGHILDWIVTAAQESGAFPTVNWSSVQDTLNAVNYIFPLNESVTIVTGLFTLWLSMLTYRMVKSWIPTESS